MDNSGTISAEVGVSAINNQGILITLDNSGTISAGDGGSGVYNAGTITTLNNSSTISAANGGFGLFNNGTITTLDNSGTISPGVSGYGIYNELGATITTLDNSGTISAVNSGFGLFNAGTITTLNNSGTVAVLNGLAVYNTGTITRLENSGTISGVAGGYNIGTITTLNTSGAISGAVYGFLNEADGTISTLNNSGTISGGLAGFYNTGTTTTLNNSGSISAGDNGDAIYNTGTINAVYNSGTITAGDSGTGISNYEIINTVDNSGNVSVGANGYGLVNTGTIATLNNSGAISAGVGGMVIGNAGTIDILKNSGTISTAVAESAFGFGFGIYNINEIATLDNLGTISVEGGGYGIYNNSGTITALNNSGTISAGIAGIANFSTIDTLSNSGTISAGTGGTGIVNTGTITTLNNAQGGNGATPATTELTYSGNLPTNYNVVISSATRYGQLAVTDPVGSITNFGISGAPFITTRNYAGVLSGTALPTGTSSGAYDNMTWSLTANGGAFDLAFAGVSLMGTQQSLVNTANALAPVYALQNAVLSNSFSYDCPVFGEHNVCVSAGGRNTAVSAANGLNNTSALLIAAYRIKPTLRIGAYADQNLSVSNAGGTVNLGNSTPLIGLFGVWNQRLDGTGTEVKVAAAYGQKNATVNRQIVGLSEAGSGSSNLNSQGAQITAKYGFAVLPDVLVSPYVGVRYTQNNMGGYTEGASSTVTAPLTYAALNTNATTALAGVGASYRFIPKATAFASAGVETDTNTSNGTYSATGVTGLTPVNFNPNPVKTRPTATLGAYYDIVKNQRIGITGIYRQESYQAISTTTVMATYTIGL